MTSGVDYTRPEILGMAGYTPGLQPVAGSSIIKLNTNESPYPPSPAVVQVLTRLLADPSLLRRYPDPLSSDLRRQAARLAECDFEQVIAGNGSDELLRILLDAFVGEGEEVGFFTPSYSLYPVLIRIRGGRPRPLALRRKGGIYLPDAAALSGLKLFFLTSPNAPFGFSFSNAFIRELSSALSGILVVDEAYADFAEENALPLLAELDNLVILRTLSKSYGLASLRVGLGFAAAPLVEQLDKVRDSYNLDRLAQSAACAALVDQDYLRRTVAMVIQERQHLSAALENLGFKVEPSQTNFVFVEPPAGCEAAKLYLGLEKAGIMVRYFSDPALRHGLRISIGTRAEMERLLFVVKDYLESH
ncbi:MAG: histidinol-phosphate transaminase [Deltaproteobacteria bacterium]|nr:histidinol-phosphate transaminase [Deltaproteobacteria bacterium]